MPTEHPALSAELVDKFLLKFNLIKSEDDAAADNQTFLRKVVAVSCGVECGVTDVQPRPHCSFPLPATRQLQQSALSYPFLSLLPPLGF